MALNAYASEFVPIKHTTVYSLYYSKWFEGITNVNSQHILKSVNDVWTILGPWQESHTITLQTLYDVYRIDATFTKYTLDLELLFLQIKNYLDEFNNELESYIGMIEDDLAINPDDTDLIAELARLKLM